MSHVNELDRRDENELDLKSIGGMERLVLRYGARMLRTARGILADPHEAEDAVQDAWVAALGAKDQFQGRSRTSTWLHRIVVNVCLMRLRHRRAVPPPRSIDEGPHRSQDVAVSNSETADIAAEATRQETVRILRDGIARLPERHRRILTLRDIDQLDTAAAAERIGVSVNAAKIRLHRARRALRLLVEDRLTDSPGLLTGSASPPSRLAAIPA